MRRIVFTLLLLALPAYGADLELSWQPPTTNVDGTPLTDLAGYKVYWGSASKQYDNNADAGNVTTYTVKDIPEGTWYFAVTAYDLAGNESDYSNEAVANVKIPPSAPMQVTCGAVNITTCNGCVIDCGGQQ